MKKLLIVMAIMIVITSGLMITANAAVPQAAPPNTNNYQYYVHFESSSNTNTQVYIYSSVQGTLVGTNLDFEGGNQQWYIHIVGDTTWREPSSSNGYENANCGVIYDANFNIGTFINVTAEITSPVDGYSYAIDNPPSITFTYNGQPNEYDVAIISGTMTYIIDSNNVNYDAGIATIMSTDYVKPDGQYKIRVMSSGALHIPVYDEVTINAVDDAETVICEFVNIVDGETYEIVPTAAIQKQNYNSRIQVKVNSKVVFTENKLNSTCRIAFNALDYSQLGLNTYQLINLETNVVIQEIQITVNTLQEPQTGISGGQNGEPIDQWSTIGDPPIMPGAGANVIDWVVYIAKMIGYLFELAFTAMKEFANQIGQLLVSLFGIISPVLSFVTIMFASLPAPIATGLYGLFVLGVVFAMLRIIRR